MNNMNMIKVVSKKLVKPCIPTPPRLKTYKLSFIDQIVPQTQVGVVLLYASSRPNQLELEQSLSKTLLQFYPLAGRYISKDQVVDCSDQGAELVEAEAPGLDLASLLVERDLENLQCFLPSIVEAASDCPILSIQTTKLLKCGGLVIGISVSHKIFDVSSVGTFIAAWSEACRSQNNTSTVSPSFDGNSVFPAGKNQSNNLSLSSRDVAGPKIVAKRFTFSKNSITRLKSRVRPGERVSRVRVVCAVIAKAMIGLDRAKHDRSRDCFLGQPMNMRERTIPPLNKHSCGNLVLPSVSRCIPATEAEEMDIQELVDLIGDTINKSISKCSEILTLDVEGWEDTFMGPRRTLMARAHEASTIAFTDWSKCGFYEADFGWGKPVWAANIVQPTRNIVVLMENKEEDGIDAWVHLDNKDITLFEQEFADSIN